MPAKTNEDHPLVRARAARGWTQRELAESAHLSVSQLSRLESGAYRPHPATVAALAAALKIDPQKLSAQLDEVAGQMRCAACATRVDRADAWCRACGEPLR